MGTRIERASGSRAWLFNCVLGAVSFVVALLVIRGGAAANDPVQVMPWQSETSVVPVAAPRSLQRDADDGSAQVSWLEECAEDCRAPEPVTMTPEEALELRAEEDALSAALQQEAAAE